MFYGLKQNTKWPNNILPFTSKQNISQKSLNRIAE